LDPGLKQVVHTSCSIFEDTIQVTRGCDSL
jgi:hypothetical protein